VKSPPCAFPAGDDRSENRKPQANQLLRVVFGGAGVRKRAVRRTSMQPRKPLILLGKT
jgi:hypothetical protein